MQLTRLGYVCPSLTVLALVLYGPNWVLQFEWRPNCLICPFLVESVFREMRVGQVILLVVCACSLTLLATRYSLRSSSPLGAIPRFGIRSVSFDHPALAGPRHHGLNDGESSWISLVPSRNQFHLEPIIRQMNHFMIYDL